MRLAASIAPAAVPEILGEDPETGAFAMAYLAPDLAPALESAVAGRHDRPARGGRRRRRSRPDPRRDRRSARRGGALSHRRYLLRDPPRAVSRGDRGKRIRTLPRGSWRSSRPPAPTKRVLVHGDFSPKNLLIGDDGPVILDAECAWYGDPAFDVAFVLNHLLLKGAWRPQWRDRYAAAFHALVDAYDAHVHWEPRPALAARIAALLPALMLARVDGKSPVEYLTDDTVKDRVRAFARGLLAAPETDPQAIATTWVACGVSTADRPRAGPPRLGFARTPDRRSGDHARQRRPGTRDRARRRVARLARGGRPARWRVRTRRLRRRTRGGEYRGADRRRARRDGRRGPARHRPGVDRARRNTRQVAPGRQRDGRGFDSRRARGRGGARRSVVAIAGGGGRGHAAAARDPDLRRRRACRPADRRPGPDGDAAWRRVVRRSAGDGGRRLSRGGRADGGRGSALRSRRRRRMVAGFRDQRRGASDARARDRTRWISAGRRRGDFARYRGVRIRAQRPLRARPG